MKENRTIQEILSKCDQGIEVISEKHREMFRKKLESEIIRSISIKFPADSIEAMSKEILESSIDLNRIKSDIMLEMLEECTK